MKIITRFAPSPTGNLHIGGVRTALFNYLFTKKQGGTYILRIDDTDKIRSTKAYEENILQGFKNLGLLWDNKDLIRQSERTAVYEKYINKLLAEDKAYISKEQPTEDGQRSEVIRIRNQNKKVSFSDLVRGEVEFDTTELGDFVIAKAINEPIYHFASVVDDYEMNITHVIRAEEHLSNTPRQILIQEAIGAPRPLYAHIPMILAPDRSKLSKRHGATALTDYLNRGYLPDAILNYLAFLGWNPGDEREMFLLPELVEAFDIGKVQKAGAIFNIEKLNWYNKQYLARMSDEKFIELARNHVPQWLQSDLAKLTRLAAILKEKITVLSDIESVFSNTGELYFSNKLPDYDKSMLLWKKNPDASASLNHLSKCKELINSISAEQFNSENIKNALWAYAEQNGKGDVLWPLRVSLTGQERSPDPFVSAYILGKDEAIRRIDSAISKLGQ